MKEWPRSVRLCRELTERAFNKEYIQESFVEKLYAAELEEAQRAKKSGPTAADRAAADDFRAGLAKLTQEREAIEAGLLDEWKGLSESLDAAAAAKQAETEGRR